LLRFLGAKYAINAFAATHPTVGAYSTLPGPIAGFKGHTSKQKRGQVREGRWGRVGREKRKWKRGGKGAYWYFFFPTSSPAVHRPQTVTATTMTATNHDGHKP